MITSKDNPKIKAAARLRESAGERREEGLFFLEGYRLCHDAIASGYLPETLFVTERAREKYPLPREVPVMLVSGPIAQKLADTQTPQGIFGVFRRKAGKGPGFWQPGGHYLALEQVQDPGNLGGIARTAEALGLDGLLLCGGCDMFHPKALRASMGALLRLPVLEMEGLAEALAGCGLPCYAAVPDRTAQPVTQCVLGRGCVVAIGNEGNGLSSEVIAACDGKVTVPMPGRAESLNAMAAATILLWEMTRQRNG